MAEQTMAPRLLVAAAVGLLGGCAGAGGKAPAQERSAHALEQAGYSVLLVERDATKLQVHVAGRGTLASLRTKEQRRANGLPCPGRAAGKLCAHRVALDGTEQPVGRCVAWTGVHVAPGPAGGAAAGPEPKGVAIRLADPATGTGWLLRDDRGNEARWP